VANGVGPVADPVPIIVLTCLRYLAVGAGPFAVFKGSVCWMMTGARSSACPPTNSGFLKTGARDLLEVP
jgi:hypothetical protein